MKKHSRSLALFAALALVAASAFADPPGSGGQNGNGCTENCGNGGGQGGNGGNGGNGGQGGQGGAANQGQLQGQAQGQIQGQQQGQAQGQIAVGIGQGGTGQGGAGGAGGSANATSNSGGNTLTNQGNTLTGGAITNGPTTANSTTEVNVIHEATKRAAASAVAPSGSNSDKTCFGYAGGGVQTPAFGISAGKSILDEGCNTIRTANHLRAEGFKDASIVITCSLPGVREAMELAGTPCPGPRPSAGAPAGAKVTAATTDDPFIKARLERK